MAKGTKKPPAQRKPRKLGPGMSRYDCTENDNHLILVMEDGDLGEIQVGDCLENAWIVVGFKDLQAALASVGYSVTRREVAPATDELRDL